MRTALILVAALSLTATAAHAGDPAAGQSPSPPQSPEFRSFGYARLGYGGVFADLFRGGPAIGLGYRGETSSYAVDVSFLNFVIRSDPYGSGDNIFSGSTLKLQGLRFLNPDADRSVYVGGGLSWGVTNVGRGSSTSGQYMSAWRGSGLQGEITTGYEFRGRSPVRAFVQGEVGLPLYRATADSYTFFGGPGVPGLPTRTIEKRYIPSLVVSFGLGWDAKKRRPS